jgi:hypothetical protein
MILLFFFFNFFLLYDTLHDNNCLDFPALGCCHTSHLNFCFGLSVGLVISFLIASFSSLQTPLILTRKYAADKFDSYLSSRSLQEVARTYDEMHEDMDKRISQKDIKEINFDDEHKHHGE